MKTLITKDLVRDLPAADQDIWDTRCRGLVLRTRASGRHSYRFMARRGRWLTIGPVDDFEPEEARREAEKLRGDIAHGKDPHAERRARHAASFKLYLDTEYGPWLKAHHKTGAETLQRLEAVFSEFGPLPLKDITQARVERWRTKRLEGGTKPSTVNRDLAALRGALSRAVDFGLLREHPLRRVKTSRVDNRGVVRYLTPEEEARLRTALADRDATRKAARERANEWRRVRGYDELPAIGTYAGDLSPLVLLALNTGLRRGELFGLLWDDVNLTAKLLIVRGDGTKSGQTRVVNLNSEAVQILRAWKPAQVTRDALVFPGRNGERDDLKTAWQRLLKAADVTRFRFHDLRHTFASKLVMAGVDLNTVRELLGHSDLKMTIRYAHLAPAVKASAVERLIASSAPQGTALLTPPIELRERK